MKSFTPFLIAGAIFACSNLHAAEPSEAFEKDRKAILAMTGDFEVNFYFHETLPLQAGYKTIGKPYEEDAYETVKVAEDDGKRIVLQHILQVDRVVVKHWSQVWTYEDQEILEFQGHSKWEKKSVSEADAKGKWTQRVTEVTDAPRYEAAGKWVHHDESSEWTSDVTSRPLPRREYTSRSDYDFLAVTNRHTVTSNGWHHEQDNTKWVKRDGKQFPLCREVGLNRYIRVTDGEFARANSYWDKTAGFWKTVRTVWDESIASRPVTVLQEKVNDASLYKNMEAMGKRVTQGETVSDAEIRSLIASFLAVAPDQTKP
ncbi:MAG: DUF6607 family protein [Verrucomicrobiota bacterium]